METEIEHGPAATETWFLKSGRVA